MQGVLATELNPLVDNKTIELNSIIRVVKFAVNSIKNHKLIWVTEIAAADTVRGSPRIGEPVNVDTPGASGSSTPAAAVFLTLLLLLNQFIIPAWLLLLIILIQAFF